MLYSFFVVVLLAAASVNAAALREDGRIIGGEDAVIETYPYQVSLENQGRHDCGASIISEHWVVTAGHCIYGDNEDLRIRAGSSFTNRNGSLHKVNQTIIRENYKLTNDGVPLYDVALIQVVEPFVFDDTRQPIKMLEAGEVTHTGSWAIVTGWGQTDKKSYKGQLQSVAVPIVDKKTCMAAYEVKKGKDGIFEGQICAADYGKGGRDSCQGDSGGPMAINGKLTGIVSWGYGCADPDYPGVYTEVAYHREWIRKNSGV